MDGSLQFGMLTRRSTCLIFLFISALAFCQGARYENHPAMKARADGALVAASATIAVCTQPANTSTQPCSPLATLYTDATLATPCTGTLKDGSVAGATNCSNPLVTDAKGNYHFYAATNVPYTLQTYGSGLTVSVEPDITLPCGPINCSVTGAITAQTLQGIPHCKDYATPGVTPFQTMMANCVAALPTTGPGTVNAMDVTDTTNLTMTGTWTMSRNGTTILFGQYTVNQGTNSIVIPSPTSGVKFLGCCAYGSIPSGGVFGTYFKYTGTGTAHQFGDTSATSYNHDVEDIVCDLTGASGSAHCLDSTRVFGSIINRFRGFCPVAANTMTFIQNNGGTVAPGAQSMKVEETVENNCQFGFVNTGQQSPPLCNNVKFIGGQYSGNSAAGSIGVDIECGNDIEFFGPYMNGYDTGLKVASPSGFAVWGKIHMESCVTTGILLTAAANNNHLWSDTGCVITDTTPTNQNTVDDSTYTSNWDWFFGAVRATGTANASIFSHAINTKLAGGLPAATTGGSGGWIAGGVGGTTAIRIWCGDGGGNQCDFAKRTGSTDTVVATIGDSGLIKGASFGTNTNCAVNSVSPAACGSATSGAFVVPTTTATYTVNTSAVTAASRIFLEPMSFAGNLPSTPTCVVPTTPFISTISAISAGVSFTFTLPSTTGQTCWQYWVVN